MLAKVQDVNEYLALKSEEKLCRRVCLMILMLFAQMIAVPCTVIYTIRLKVQPSFAIPLGYRGQMANDVCFEDQQRRWFYSQCLAAKMAAADKARARKILISDLYSKVKAKRTFWERQQPDGNWLPSNNTFCLSLRVLPLEVDILDT